jgi:X-X-X-Leu-X-X-Gly heptad repeat protein
MNKTLLLILCDFLLLNLLALTRWEKAEPPRPKQPPVPELAANSVTKEQDLVETMRQSLADEKTTRDELAQKLSSTESTLATREQSLNQLQSERAKLAQEKDSMSATLTETQKTAADLGKKVATATQEATMTKEQLAQLQRELAEKQAEAERQKQQLAALEKQHADARKQIEGLTMAVVVAEQEKKNLRETAENLKGQVDTERTERLKVQEANTQLAQGVGQLAEKSGELTKEIRENRPVNANVLYNDFLNQRVTATFKATRKVFIGNPTRTTEPYTVLVTDGKQVFALLHIADTPFTLGEPGSGVDWEGLSVDLAHGGAGRSAAPQVQFLAQDPRIVVLPIDASQAASLGAKVYPLAADPFKFPEAVLIDGGGRGYGEVGFKLDASQPGFVRVDNRFFKRMFGDFAPKRGDLVFSKTGEFLGLMVNSDYCAVVKDFTAAQTIRPGADIKGQATGAILEQLSARLRSLPLKLQ